MFSYVIFIAGFGFISWRIWVTCDVLFSSLLKNPQKVLGFYAVNAVNALAHIEFPESYRDGEHTEFITLSDVPFVFQVYPHVQKKSIHVNMTRAREGKNC
jgi:hypothetical protein